MLLGCVGWKALAGKVAIEYSDLDSDSDLDLPEDVVESEALLTSAGVEGEQEEDISVYGKAYAAFGGGQEGKEACMALAALCEVASINTLISNFIQPLQGGDIKSVKDGRVHCSININTETGRLSARRPSLQVLCELSFVGSLIQMLDCTYVLEDKSIIVSNT
jgi:DNA polymerase-1